MGIFTIADTINDNLNGDSYYIVNIITEWGEAVNGVGNPVFFWKKRP
jgi:hypothetical protein